jgi:hypothetical protein
MVGHHDYAMQAKFALVSCQTHLYCDIARGLRQYPSLVGTKCDKERLEIRLEMGHLAAIFILSEHDRRLA